MYVCMYSILNSFFSLIGHVFPLGEWLHTYMVRVYRFHFLRVHRGSFRGHPDRTVWRFSEWDNEHFSEGKYYVCMYA
jgi:hypothetical protein